MISFLPLKNSISSEWSKQIFIRLTKKLTNHKPTENDPIPDEEKLSLLAMEVPLWRPDRAAKVRSANILDQDLLKSIVKRNGDGRKALSDFQYNSESFIRENHGGRVIRH